MVIERKNVKGDLKRGQEKKQPFFYKVITENESRTSVLSHDRSDGGATLNTSASVVTPAATFIAPEMRNGFMPSR